MQHQLICLRAMILLGVALAILTPSNVASANPCEAGDIAIKKEMEPYRKAQDEYKREIDESVMLNARIENLKEIANSLSSNDTYSKAWWWQSQIELDSYEQKLKTLKQSPRWQAWEKADTRMKNLKKRVAEDCPQEARERWEREKAWVSQKRWDVSCTGGKAFIAEARSKGYTTTVAKLAEAVEKLCEGEATSEKPAVGMTAAPTRPTSSSDISTCAEGKERIEEANRRGDDAARSELILIVADLCDREEAAAGGDSGSTAAPRCAVSKRRVQDLKQTADSMRGSGDKKQLRYALANLDNALAKTFALCEQEASAAAEEETKKKSGRDKAQSQRTAAEDDCRGKHGNRMIRVYQKNGRWFCEYKTERTVAVEDCQRQHGNRLIRVFKSGGKWRCEYRTGKAQSGGPPPRYDPRAAAAAAAAIVGIMQGITSSRSRGGGGQGGARPPPRSQGRGSSQGRGKPCPMTVLGRGC